MLVIRQNADTFTIMSQEFYSSASSDDQSSINSVVHVDIGGDSTTTDDGGGEEGGEEAAALARGRRGSTTTTTSRGRPGAPPRDPRDGDSGGDVGDRDYSGEEEDEEEEGEDEEELEVMEGGEEDEDDGLDEEDARVRRAGRPGGGGGGGLRSGREDHGGTPGIQLPTARVQPGAHDSSSDSDDDDDDDAILRARAAGHDSDSSSSSEGTQVWVPVKASPGPSNKSGVTGRNGSTPVTSPRGRQSVVSQSSVSGRAETSLAPDDHHHINAGDSGISNESPDTASSAADHHHYHHSHHHHHLPHGGSHHQHHHLSYQQSTPGGPRAAAHHVTMPPLQSPSRTPHPEEAEVTTVQQEAARDGVSIRESLFNILSGLYALLLVTMGAALPVAEIFAAPVAPGVFEIFYIYLFGVSIVFLLYVYTFLLSERTTSRLCRRRHLGEDSPFNKWSRRVTIGQAHTGSFYLRLGAVAFGIGAMIHEGLMFGELFEFELTSPCVKVTEAIRPVLHLAFTFIQLYFIFLNSKMCIHKYRTFARFGLTHMVATNLCVWFRTVAKETIRDVTRQMRQHNISMYGMHVTWGGRNTSAAGAAAAPSATGYNAPLPATTATATPLVVRYGGTRFPEADSTAVLNVTLFTARRTAVECPRQEILGHVVEAASPYLYPCTIEYSLIAAGILYVMWRNISKQSDAHLLLHGPQGLSETASSHSGRGTPKPEASTSVDCAGANRGLFLGIFTLVAAIISTIVFFVLVERPEYVGAAVIVVHSSELILYCLAAVAVVAAAYRIRKLQFNAARDSALDETLLLVALAGQYAFCVFGAVAGRFNTESRGGLLVMATSLLIMLQATVQTVFILHALRRSSPRPYHEAGAKKPGREYITFVLVCNIAMWGMNTFEALRAEANPITLEFYGYLPWSVLVHLSSPLAIFYRFHSTVCLANIWKNAYKQRPVIV